MLDIDELCGVIAAHRFHYATEDALQEALGDVLTAGGFDVHREVRLDWRNRIDLMVDTLGIEVKVNGSPADVARQLRRYAKFDQIESLLLVTNRVRHTRLAGVIDGKPVRVLPLVSL